MLQLMFKPREDLRTVRDIYRRLQRMAVGGEDLKVHILVAMIDPYDLGIAGGIERDARIVDVVEVRFVLLPRPLGPTGVGNDDGRLPVKTVGACE